jgi:undecaprenyl-diphosphatase
MNNKRFLRAMGLLAGFALWTLAVGTVDVRPIGPNGSEVGFAAMNGFFHGLTGVHMELYHLTDWLGLASLGICAGFGILGLVQWVGRGSIRQVDRSLLILGGFYVLVLGVFLLFELAAVNYRPVLIEGRLEASYPSSTTMLALCVLPTAMLRLRSRRVRFLLAALTAFLVIGRLLCGVHWVSDIIGGALLSAGLVTLYRCIISICFSSKL